jgi:RimJ/RimL family protein N-acetyltransferase
MREGELSVRPMSLDEAGIRIGYFHDASDEHLVRLGVDRTLLPSRADWFSFYEHDHARPVAEREQYSLVWLLNETIVGFSSTDGIEFGEQAFMHLHILDNDRRHSGLGSRFVRLSEQHYMEVLQLRRLYCQPNAFNVAPNRTLQRAGFKYVLTVVTTPSAINFRQAITRWVWEPAGNSQAVVTEAIP